MVYDSLTDAPRDFREGIDWLVALKGTDAESNLAALGAAVYKFLSDNPDDSDQLPAYQKVKLITKEFLEQEGIKDRRTVRVMLARFNTPRDLKSYILAKPLDTFEDSDTKKIVEAWGITAENIAEKLTQSVDACEKFLGDIKVPGQYMSAYSSKATWAESCSKKPEDCAAVFVGIAPMLYTGLTSLWDATDADDFRLVPSKAKKNLNNLLAALRYVKPEVRAKMDRSDVVNALSGVGIDVLDTLTEVAEFWAVSGSGNAESVEGMKGVETEELVEAGEPAEQPVDAEKSEGDEGVKSVEEPVKSVEEPIKAEATVNVVKTVKAVKAAKKAAKKVAKKAKQKKNLTQDPQ
ncbi:Probable serine threonine- kinase kinX, putative [Babesia ovata]|uniref:Probable serine threonine-kinase kinX, putative n=1 Tax=Babesia ovata TaxID=189622 RepID=A0A2H6K949_9APIC|nr:Probable serine threonine- kinase kinX, putative [Babesia ovata]GBE59508.1 Probable serine threonine- kinase kinX, putative [Babesia ovata]